MSVGPRSRQSGPLQDRRSAERRRAAALAVVAVLAASLLAAAPLSAAADPFAPYAAPAEDRADAPGPSSRRLQDAAVVRAALDRCLAEAAEAGARPESCLGRASEVCHGYAVNQTTLGSIQCSTAEAEAWDGVLNETYGRAMAALDSGARTALKDAQRKWIAYRDSACAVWGEVFRGGSMARQVGADCFREQTGRRALDLLALADSVAL